MQLDQLKAEEYQAQTCNYPVRDKGDVLRAVLWVFFVFATLFAIFRALSRMPQLGGTGFSWDDAILFSSYILAVILVAATEMQLANGAGKDEYTLTSDQIVTYTYVSFSQRQEKSRLANMVHSGRISTRSCTKRS